MRFVHHYFKSLKSLFFHTNTNFPSARFVASLALGERSLGIICQKSSSWRETRRNISVGGRGCL